MATMPQMLCLLSVLISSFGALYFSVNSHFDDVCDYQGVVDSCADLKKPESNISFARETFLHNWHMEAQDVRNQSEAQKCREEDKGMQRLIAYDRKEAHRIVDKCMADFQTCIYQNYDFDEPTTTPTPENVECFDLATGVSQSNAPSLAISQYVTCITDPAKIDCFLCDMFCNTMNWVEDYPDYAKVMGYRGHCTHNVCPWAPQCSPNGGLFLSASCSVRGCECPKPVCKTRVMSTTTNIEVTNATANTTTTTVTITNGIGFGGGRRLREETENNETEGPPPCTCDEGYVDLVLVGRPFKTFFADKAFGPTTAHTMNHNDVKHMQGVVVELEDNITSGDFVEESCQAYFSNKYKYYGPRQVGAPGSQAAVNARGSLPDLGCGYKGNFAIRCKQVGPPENGQCRAEVDISTCSPPTYEEALDSCYKMAPRSVPIPQTEPKYNDWLAVEVLNLTVSQAANAVNMTPPDKKCCEVHVSSTCEPGRTFAGTNASGAWVPAMSVAGSQGYFPLMDCSSQAAPGSKPCPMVTINHVERVANSVINTFPLCRAVCNLTSMREELGRLCNTSKHPQREKERIRLHNEKIRVMQEGRDKLQAWSAANFPYVGETNKVHDCVTDSLAGRFNSLGMPSWRSGFTKLRLHNLCRLHGCKQHQCLRVKRPCPISTMDTHPETQCTLTVDDGTYECVDKVLIMSLHPTSPGFATTWFVVSVFLGLAAAIVYCVETISAANKRAEEIDRAKAIAHREAEKARVAEVLNNQKANSMERGSTGPDTNLALLDENDPESQMARQASGANYSLNSRAAAARARAKAQLAMEYAEDEQYAQGVTHPNAVPALTDGNAMDFEEDNRVIVVQGRPVPVVGSNERRQHRDNLTIEELSTQQSHGWLQIPDRKSPSTPQSIR